MSEERSITNEFVRKDDERYKSSAKQVDTLIEYFKLNDIGPQQAFETSLNALLVIGWELDFTKKDMLAAVSFLKEGIDRNWKE